MDRNVNKADMETIPSNSNGTNQKLTLINFLNPVLKPSISCSVASAEDYPIENLVSDDRIKSQLGFIVYLSKPPVDLMINLPCSIELISIKIWPEIGSLKSTGFDVFIIKNTGQEKIATCAIVDENGVMFCPLNDAEVCANNFKKSFFFRNFKTKFGVDKLMLRIWKTKNSCVPVIKKMEIWGKVSGNSASSDSVEKLWKARNDSQYIPSTLSNSDTLESHSSKCTNDIEVPEQFLDAITHQIMTVPMILPSGKSVDQSTLDKFNKVEMTWGREPSDPFTGMTFTVSRKPIFDPALKSGIDKFLNQFPNSLQFKNIPRTVGTVFGNCKRGAAMVSQHADDGHKRLKMISSSSNDTGDSNSKYLSRTMKRTSDEIHCYNCRAIEELYRIMSCDRHLICRTCLRSTDFSKNINQCSCGRHFSQKDVTKYHSSNVAFNYCLS